MPRYKYSKILNNDIEFYDFLRKERNNVRNIRMYETQVMHNPTVRQRAGIQTTQHIWTLGDRYYQLAHQYYQEPQYWWVIAWYNGYPTEADVKPGDVLTIPTNLEQALTVLGAY